MNRLATMLLLLAGLLVVQPTWAQRTDLTVRQIHDISAEALATLQQSTAETSGDEIETLVTRPLTGTEVTITVVVLADPFKSGLSSPRDAGFPSRVHYFVRDTTANSQGALGMDVQVVDGDYQNTGSLDIFRGDVVEMTATVDRFGNTLQLTPTTITVQGVYDDFGLPDEILDPVTVTTADLHRNVGEAQVQVNWDNFPLYDQQYVRIEGATVWRSPNRTADRPNWAITSDGAQTIITSDDISLRYRNDRVGAYNEVFDLRDDNFEAPLPGATVNVQGFALLRGGFDPFTIGAPSTAMYRIAPWEDGDLEVTAAPSIGAVAVGGISAVPAADTPVPVSVAVSAEQANVGSVRVRYTTSLTTEPADVELTLASDTTYTGDIPGQPDGTFVTYSAIVTDTGGSEFPSDNTLGFRVLNDGIDEISDIQETASGGFGDSPFVGGTFPMNLTAVVQSNGVDNGRFVVLQDKEGLDAWSGILVPFNEALGADLQPGDIINITEGRIFEGFDVTNLTDIVYTKTGSGNPYGYKVVTTDILQDPAIVEAHEGILLRFEDVTITNPDAGFGEWSFSTDGTEDNELNADDRSNSIAGDFASTTFTEGEMRLFMQGVGWYSFGAFKLVPETLADIGDVGSTSTEANELPERVTLQQNYPNPFNPSTSITYSMPTGGDVTLEVTDLLGRSVALLVDGVQASGQHTVTFDASQLASGVYLYRLTAGDQTVTRTMLLLK